MTRRAYHGVHGMMKMKVKVNDGLRGVDVENNRGKLIKKKVLNLLYECQFS